MGAQPGCLLIFRRVRDNRPVTLKIDIDDSAPPYEQVRARISEQARSGALPVGYRLPTVRGLAESLGLAANTVAKAYRALEADGVIETRGRNGTFVAAAGSAADRELAVGRPGLCGAGPAARARRRRMRWRRYGMPCGRLTGSRGEDTASQPVCVRRSGVRVISRPADLPTRANALASSTAAPPGSLLKYA